MPDIYQKSIALHQKLKGKLEITSKVEINNKEDLSLLYSPGVARPCEEIAENEEKVYDYTLKGNTIAVVSDGSAVLGLGNIGAKAALPVMEGKAILFKKFAGINAFPICLATQNTEEIISIIKNIAPVFGGINLEDISAPRCFEIEARLQNIGIPVFHDDQHGTAIVTLAGLINACKVVGKNIADLKVVINGAGSAGVAIAKLLRCISLTEQQCTTVKDIIMCDSKGVIYKDRSGLDETKQALAQLTNKNQLRGTLKDALKEADIFIGVSKGNLLYAEDIKLMAKNPVIFALANPEPEIMPDEAKKGGAAIISTGRSDFPNQVNNVLVFPGIFKGALQQRAPQITPEMKLAAAYALAACVKHPTAEKIIPSIFEAGIAENVAAAVSSFCEIISKHRHQEI